MEGSRKERRVKLEDMKNESGRREEKGKRSKRREGEM